MTETDEILVRLVATMDAIHRPPRELQWSTEFPRNSWVERQLFATVGLQERSSQPSAAARAAFWRVVQHLADAGLVISRRAKGLRWPHLAPTPDGDDRARAMAGVPRLDACLALMAEMTSKRRDCFSPEGWLSERWLTSDDPDWHELRAVEAMAAPGLWRGWLQSHSDRNGHVRYRLLDAGRVVLADHEEADDDTDDEADAAGDPAAAKYYFEHLDAAIARLEVADPADPREIGPAPLPCSMPGRLPAALMRRLRK